MSGVSCYAPSIASGDDVEGVHGVFGRERVFHVVKLFHIVECLVAAQVVVGLAWRQVIFATDYDALKGKLLIFPSACSCLDDHQR